MSSSSSTFAKEVLTSLYRDLEKLKSEHAWIADRHADSYVRSWLEARLRREANLPALPLDVL